MAHDLLVLNSSGYESETFNEALAKFATIETIDYIDKGNSEESLLETGFEYGFWAAVSALTGYKSAE